MPYVLNMKQDSIPPEAVYVGRPSKWGNPFGLHSGNTREEVVGKYAAWLLTSEKGKKLLNDLHELEGKDLVCFCAPKLCHADILLAFANGYPNLDR